MKIFKLASVALISVLALTGCAPAQAPIDGKVKIVASTSVWADVAKSVGGDLVEVTTIIDSPTKDPHSYEATARDQLAVDKSNLVIANGGGYDDFIEKLAQAAGNKTILRLVSAATAVQGQENEHIWYSISAVGEATYAIADALGSIDEKNNESYAANADKFLQGLTGIAGMYSQVREKVSGKSYIATEPIAEWLLNDLKMVNKTPQKFTDAIENETDVPPTVMDEALKLISSGQVEYLVVNVQTLNTQVRKLIDAAKAAGVRQVLFSELPPTGTGYVEWMGENLVTLDPAE